MIDLDTYRLRLEQAVIRSQQARADARVRRRVHHRRQIRVPHLSVSTVAPVVLTPAVKPVKIARTHRLAHVPETEQLLMTSPRGLYREIAQRLGISKDQIARVARGLRARGLVLGLTEQEIRAKAEVERQRQALADKQARREERIAYRLAKPTRLAQQREARRLALMSSDRGRRIQLGLDAGETLEMMGRSVGITRERVRQLIVQMGIDHEAVSRARREVEKIQRAEAHRRELEIRRSRIPTYNGKRQLPEYQVYRGMLQRCYNKNNPSYSEYGGRGVTVCERWRGRNGYQHFVIDMGERPEGKLPSGRALYTINRIDNALVYSKETCEWATQKRQCAPGQRRLRSDSTDESTIYTHIQRRTSELTKGDSMPYN